LKFKALVLVRLRASVSDAAGNAVRNNTKTVAKDLDVSVLRLGKAIDLEFEASDRETAKKELNKLSDKMLANTVIEDWSYELSQVE
jgi:phosphoribosylformylglycinamidine synthase